MPISCTSAETAAAGSPDRIAGTSLLAAYHRAVEPVVVHRDHCDFASDAGLIARSPEHAGKALGEAFEGDRDEARAKADALALLRSAREGIDVLIAEVEREG